jgi:hypothetical protein
MANMLSPSITDWMSSTGAVAAAGAAIVAAGAAVLAARYTKQAVYEAAKAAKAAADQVELQRPRPVVLLTFSYSFKHNRNTDEERFREFHLENIGNSPAFDVEVSSIEVPDATDRLTTEQLSHLLVSRTHACKHRLDKSQGVLGVLQPAETFANALAAYFNQHSEGTLAERIEKRHQIEFTLSYRALDRRRFEQRYAFLVFFPKQRVWIEPMGSLLESSGDGVQR